MRIVGLFPDPSHPPIVYPIALTHKHNSEAQNFIAYVRSTAGDLVFKAYGFTPLH